MLQATVDKGVMRPARFFTACVVIFAVLALILNVRRFGFALIFRIGTPVIALTLAWTWQKADDSKVSVQLGNGILVFMFIASIADVVWSIFLP